MREVLPIVIGADGGEMLGAGVVECSDCLGGADWEVGYMAVAFGPRPENVKG